MQIEIQGWYSSGGSGIGISIGVFDVEVLPPTGTTMNFITTNDYPDIPAGSQVLCEVTGLWFNLYPGAPYRYWVIVGGIRSSTPPSVIPLAPAMKGKKVSNRAQKLPE